MSEPITIRKGIPIELAEAESLDRVKMGVALCGPPVETDVAGQRRYMGLTQCPWCGQIARCEIDSDLYTWFTCGQCGRPFRS
jgi:predicted RNA-binding Zn-ribbon protein involved in translation (DUF1610 family)